jgi:DNA-directed RNA polymerase subunit RPC12/RpoP
MTDNRKAGITFIPDKNSEEDKEIIKLIKEYYRERGMEIQDIEHKCSKCGNINHLKVAPTIKKMVNICHKCSHKEIVYF